MPKVDFEVLDVSFDAIRDPQEREYSMNLPTSFVLPDEAVVGGLGGKPPTKLTASR